MNARAVPIAVGLAFLILAVLAFVGTAGTVVSPLWRPFPPEVMAAAGIGLAALAAAWLSLARYWRGWLTAASSIGGVLGLLIGVFGIWGTTQILSDFCWRPEATATLASSIPPLTCGDVTPSILVGAYLIAVGVVSVGSLAVLMRGQLEYE